MKQASTSTPPPDSDEVRCRALFFSRPPRAAPRMGTLRGTDDAETKIGPRIEAGFTRLFYLVPFVEDEHTVFLKTIIPSRKATKQYLGEESDNHEN